jgi:hypothetical protein
VKLNVVRRRGEEQEQQQNQRLENRLENNQEIIAADMSEDATPAHRPYVVVVGIVQRMYMATVPLLSRSVTVRAQQSAQT